MAFSFHGRLKIGSVYSSDGRLVAANLDVAMTDGRGVVAQVAAPIRRARQGAVAAAALIPLREPVQETETPVYSVSEALHRVDVAAQTPAPLVQAHEIVRYVGELQGEELRKVSLNAHGARDKLHALFVRSFTYYYPQKTINSVNLLYRYIGLCIDRLNLNLVARCFTVMLDDQRLDLSFLALLMSRPVGGDLPSYLVFLVVPELFQRNPEAFTEVLREALQAGIENNFGNKNKERRERRVGVARISTLLLAAYKVVVEKDGLPQAERVIRDIFSSANLRALVEAETRQLSRGETTALFDQILHYICGGRNLADTTEVQKNLYALLLRMFPEKKFTASAAAPAAMFAASSQAPDPGCVTEYRVRVEEKIYSIADAIKLVQEAKFPESHLRDLLLSLRDNFLQEPVEIEDLLACMESFKGKGSLTEMPGVWHLSVKHPESGAVYTMEGLSIVELVALCPGPRALELIPAVVESLLKKDIRAARALLPLALQAAINNTAHNYQYPKDQRPSIARVACLLHSVYKSSVWDEKPTARDEFLRAILEHPRCSESMKRQKEAILGEFAKSALRGTFAPFFEKHLETRDTVALSSSSSAAVALASTGLFAPASAASAAASSGGLSPAESKSLGEAKEFLDRIVAERKAKLKAHLDEVSGTQRSPDDWMTALVGIFSRNADLPISLLRDKELFAFLREHGAVVTGDSPEEFLQKRLLPGIANRYNIKADGNNGAFFARAISFMTERLDEEVIDVLVKFFRANQQISPDILQQPGLSVLASQLLIDSLELLVEKVKQRLTGAQASSNGASNDCAAFAAASFSHRQ